MKQQLHKTMPPRFNPHDYEEKWMRVWDDAGLFQHTVSRNHDGDKLYLLFAFAYPSGTGLHVGHVESKTALDILARYHRAQGKQVFFPTGYDAFGLPAENYAVKTGIHPAQTTAAAIETFRRQVKRIGISYDFAAEVITCNPNYYQWTQWIFIQLFKKGLAYRDTALVNWCPSCKTVLANEQVIQKVKSQKLKVKSNNAKNLFEKTVGVCERCDTEVMQKDMEQWFFRVTQYKDELIFGLDTVDWPEATKQQQLNWIGRSDGLAINFPVSNKKITLTVWTKFWETVFGVTFLVISPEKFREFGLLGHVPDAKKAAVEQYLQQAAHKTEAERKIGRDKTGVDTGLTVNNPVNATEVPLFIADYVLADVGTGVVMGVPAHDARDFAFAKKYHLPIQQVVAYSDAEINTKVIDGTMSFDGEGVLVNSGEFDGMDAWGQGKQKMAQWMIAHGFAQWKTTYKLRDWLISRQRYWGAPIPIVYDPNGTPHAVKQEHLPWKLPTDVEFRPTGESPLKFSHEFKRRVEKLYGAGWTPEYDTMDTFVDSSWYFLRYPTVSKENSKSQVSNHKQIRNSKSQNAKRLEFGVGNLEIPWDSETTRRWLPVDFYMIGPEHIVLHLLYSRFFWKFFRDEGLFGVSQDDVSSDARPASGWDEPFLRMRHQGMILGPDSRKMSKSKGNVIDPDDMIAQYGADTLRMYEMFLGPIEDDKPWNTKGMVGPYKFLKKVWQLVTQDADVILVEASDSRTVYRAMHTAVKGVGEDIDALKFNTAIAKLMEFVNVLYEKKRGRIKRSASLRCAEWGLALETLLRLLAPFAPFVSEELYQRFMKYDLRFKNKKKKSIHTSYLINHKSFSSIHEQPWPEHDPDLVASVEVTIAVQVNGKLRGQVTVDRGHAENQQEIARLAVGDERVHRHIGGKLVKKTIFVPGRLINFVV